MVDFVFMVVGIVLISLCVFPFIISMVRFVKNIFAQEKTVKARVVHKQRLESFSKYSGNGKQYRYLVVFSANGKKLSFDVSEFSYGGYKVHEEGMLTYKGNRLLNFQ